MSNYPLNMVSGRTPPDKRYTPLNFIAGKYSNDLPVEKDMILKEYEFFFFFFPDLFDLRGS